MEGDGASRSIRGGNAVWDFTVLALSESAGDDPSTNDPDWAWNAINKIRFVNKYDEGPHRDASRAKHWYFVRAGWPMKALVGWKGSIKEGTTGKTFAQHAISSIPLIRADHRPRERIDIPFAPLWPGFIANTLIYAALWWLLFTGLVSARSARRTRRGLCTRCAYDLRGVPSGVCPECGEAHAH